jgi:hypothetical protein
LGHASIGHNPQGKAWGESADSWGKSAVHMKLAPIENRRGDTLHAPSTITFAASVAIAHGTSLSSIALVKTERIYLSNDLMHVFMHQIFLGSKMRELLLCTLA